MTLIGLAAGATVVAALAVAAFFLAATQAEQREELRERYADRVLVASALLDALFRAEFVGQTTELTQQLGGAEVPARALDRQVAAREATWAAVVDRESRVLGASSLAPREELRGLTDRRLVQRAFAGGGYALGEVRGDVIRTATRFPARSALAGSRVFVTALPPATLSRFLEGTLGPLPGGAGARAVILDGSGNAVAGGAREPAPPAELAQLVTALQTRSSGWIREGDEERFFAAQPISRSAWRLAITVPEATLYASVSGPSRWIPWLILLITALALATIGLLARRLVLAGDAVAAANRDLERSNAELERSNADLEQFAYAASHDLSEPLRTVAGFSQLLAQRYRGRLDEEADLYIGHMAAGVDRMQRLIDDLLLYSRVGREPIRRERVDLGELLAEVLEGCATTVEERGATVTSDALPAVRGEPRQLAQVLQNLVVNAMKFTAPGVAPVVHVGAERDGPQTWRIVVRDNGIGVAAEQREAIFKMFGRLHTTEVYPGTGIGLALVQRIVERHDGRVWVEDDPAGGSRFVFTLPAWAGSPRDAASARVPA